MDYSKLALELSEQMQLFHKAKAHKKDGFHGEEFVLHYLAEHGGEVVPSDIVKEMDVSSARIAQTLNSVEKKGFITREIDANDRRRVIVKLTDKGKLKDKQHFEMVMEHMTRMLESLGEYDAKEYVRITKKLAENFLK